MLRGGRMGPPVGGGRYAECTREAGRERPDAGEADREADLGDGAVGLPEQRRGALEAAAQQVGVRRFPERTPELTAEVRPREPCGSREIVDREPLGIATVGEVLRAQQMTDGCDELHRREFGPPRRAKLIAM